MRRFGILSLFIVSAAGCIGIEQQTVKHDNSEIKQCCGQLREDKTSAQKADNLVDHGIQVKESTTNSLVEKQARGLIYQVPHSLKPLDLSRPPTNEEIMAAGMLGGQLYPTHTVADPQREAEINLSFGMAIQEWNKHEYKHAITLFNEHMNAYPDSPWVAEAQLHMGCDAQYTGRYTEAEKLFMTIMDTHSKSDADGPQKMVLKAQLRMGVLKTFQNNLPEAEKQFTELMQKSGDWRDRTYASHWLQRLSRLSTNKLAMLNCGTQALAHLLEKGGKGEQARSVRDILPQSLSGHSMEDVKEIAAEYGYTLDGFRIVPETLTKIPLPAIVQIQGKDQGDSGHYWVVEKVADGRLDLYDAQAGRYFSQSIEEFTKEWHGDILIFQSEKVAGAFDTKLTQDELNGTFGGCCGIPRGHDDLGPPPDDGCKHGCCGRCCGSCGCGASPGAGGGYGAPAWAVNEINMNLYVYDTPLWFDNPIGPSVAIKLSYNSQSSIARHEPFGDKWQFNYASYLVVDTGGQVTIFMPEGQNDIYSPDGQGGFRSPLRVFHVLTKLSENHYLLTFTDGTVYEYDIPSYMNGDVLVHTASLQPFLAKITDPYGKSLTFIYDNINIRLLTITDALNRNTTLEYNSDGLVSKISDPFGRFAAFNYDGSKLIKLTDMGGYASDITYDQTSYITSIGNARGATWTFYIEPSSSSSNGSNAYPTPGGSMWQNYRITITHSLGQKEEYYYNGYAGYSWYVSANDYKPYVDSYQNNYADPNVIKTIFYLTSINGASLLSEKVLPDGSKENYEYDSSTGLRSKSMDTHGHVTSYQYNSQGLPLSVTNPRLMTTSMSYATNNNDLTSISNNLGARLMTYDGFHKVTSQTNLRGKKTSAGYNDVGKLITVEDALGQVLNFSYYDLSDSNNKYQLKDITRNGQLIMRIVYDAIGRPQSRTDETGLTKVYSYDNLNRISFISYPDGKKDSYLYSQCCPALIDSITDRAGRTTSYVYDDMKRLIETKGADGATIRYAYDLNSNLQKLIDLNGNETVFSYDSNNRLVKKTYSDGKDESYVYDGAGLLLSRTGAKGVKASYMYDVNDKLAGITYSDSTPSVSYNYDLNDRIVLASDGIGAYSYSYDADSRLISLDGPWENDTITYGYDDADRLVKLQQQGAEDSAYSYDSFGRLAGIGVGSRQFTYDYPAAGASPNPVSLNRPNGTVTNFQTDQFSRLEAISSNTSSKKLVSSNIFNYNTQDQRGTESVTNVAAYSILNDNIVTYDYNKVNQLLLSSNPNRLYNYDANGNMLSGYTPDGFKFDAAYDGEDRLRLIHYMDNKSVSHNKEYFYNIYSFLTKIISDGVETRFARSGNTILQERDGNNVIKRITTWDPRAQGGIGGLLEINQSGQLYYPLDDGKGNVTTILDMNQNVVAKYSYDPFGLPVANSGTLEQPYRFSTKLYDEATGLSYFGYRYYSPLIGRWLNRDPLGEMGGLNLYAYVQNNPVNYTDPNGLVTYMCRQPLHALPRKLDSKTRSIIDVPGNPLYHQFLCVTDGNGGSICGGQDRGESKYGPFSAPGKPSSDTYIPYACEKKDGGKCLDECIIKKVNEPSRPHYGIPFGTDCQEWSDDMLKQCQHECNGK